jgi:hypothetical protein
MCKEYRIYIRMERNVLIEIALFVIKFFTQQLGVILMIVF